MLNFVSRLTGIATLTNRFVQKILLHKVKLLDTRKTTGGYRELEKYAVLTGGGNNHRIGLYDMYLIKDNHIIVAGSIKKAIEKVIAARKTKKVSIEVEVDSLKQLDEVLSLKKLPDWIMLDNLSYEEMEIGVERIRKKSKKIKIEASGGVCLENISEIAKCKVDFISVGTALTLGAKPTDVGMDIIM